MKHYAWNSPLPRFATKSALVGLTLAALATFGLAACGDDDSGGNSKEQDAANQSVQTIIKAQADADGATFLKYTTDKSLQNDFYVTRADVEQDPTIIQTDATFNIKKTTVSGDTAKVDGSSPQGDFTSYMRANMVKQDGIWKLDDLQSITGDKLKDGEDVSIGMKEFAFDFKQEDIPSGKPINFELKNTGQQAHFMEIVTLPETGDLQQMLQSPDQPAGVEEVGSSYILAPGETATVTFSGQLKPGRYAMLCFIPDTDGVPHAFKGMASDFHVK